MFKHVFLTGAPGMGKTTLVQKACEALTGAGEAVDGFYTEEVREGGRRVGFDVVTLSGKRGRLSRVGDSSGHSAGRREPRVGPYVVDIPSFENLALPLFRNMGVAEDGRKGAVFVIDEIGKMELFSQPFVRAVRQALDCSACSILGTIPVPKGSDVKVFTVTKDNRDIILQDIMAALQECIKQTS
ncbi:hypothetical protein AAFF_G00063050 [Aldrovandia affinis]|uniref:Cancer-related nucleoside-triphosphatase n=1 Tax=Aldrovandia affinis TaxID=143900 RepID=A0AAD7RZK3_9TELE|nr:hypothetical protein AAFF_G00063050 [Aldrovandia affinis]